MLRTPAIVALSLPLAVLGCTAHATIINVPGDQPTIQIGIGAATNGDTVLVAPDTYSEDFAFLGKAVTVGSWFLTTGDPAYVSATIVDGGGTFGPLVTFSAGEDSLSVLCGLTLQNGVATRGGAVLCQSSSPRIVECELIGNQASTDGGGIYVDASGPIVENCRFESNEAVGNAGGGFGVRHGSPRISGCVFTGNTAHYEGGAIFCEDSAPVISGNVVDGNSSAVTYAGGIMSRNCTAVITGNVIANNHTYGHGGGLFY
jgi:parallel beta-helix repeat protein/predicted outer membrane repeat protein